MDNQLETIELEYKYKLDNVKLTDFINLMNNIGYKKKLDISSWDHYFIKPNNTEEFQRYRESSAPELTIKRKVKATNNFQRVESDLPIDPARTSLEKISFHIGLDGYKENFKIYKTCCIYWQELCNYVYYIVYDEEMKELNRFIEVEINKNKVAELGDKAFDVLKECEQKLSVLGISPANRMKRSLFELYVK